VANLSFGRNTNATTLPKTQRRKNKQKFQIFSVFKNGLKDEKNNKKAARKNFLFVKKSFDFYYRTNGSSVIFTGSPIKYHGLPVNITVKSTRRRQSAYWKMETFFCRIMGTLSKD
jgi:hypothetical protein